MKKILALLFAFAALSSAQTNRFPAINLYTGDPTGVSCSPENSLVQSTTTGGIYSCLGGIYVAVAAGGSSLYPPIVCQLGSYTDASIAADACIATAIAQGGTADLRQLLGGGTFANPILGSQEIDCGSPTTSGGLPGVSCIFPNSSVYATSQVGGPLYATQPYVAGSGGAEGSGYTVGCTVTAPETGYGYTGTATGAVLAVATLDTVVGGGAVKTLTVTTPGSGYLSSPYVPASNTGGTCVGTGLLLRVQAKDSAIRVWGSSTAKTDSVGGGGATFVIEPYYPSGCPGYPVMDAGLSTSRFGGYSRIEGGFKIADGACQSYTYGAFRAQGQVDSARNLLIETSTPHDNGVYLETECCSGDNYLLHADSNGTGGTPVIVGGQSLLNACTTSTSTNVYAPYALPTIAWLGNIVSGAGIPNSTIITALNAPSAPFPASLTISNAATATSTGAGACTTPSVSTGSGVSLKLADPTDVSGQLQTVSIRNLVANDPGLGLPTIAVGNSANNVEFDTVYIERNVNDTYTPGIYASSASFVGFHNVRGCGAANAYCIQNDAIGSQWNWEATNTSLAGLGFNDNGTVYVNALGVDYFKYLATGNLFMSTFPTFALTGPYNNTAGATAIVNCPPTGGSSTTYCGGDGAWHTPSGTGTVTNFLCGTFPSWLACSVATSTSTPTLSVTSTLTLANVAAGTAASGTYNFQNAALIAPVSAGYTATANGRYGYDSTGNNWHWYQNGGDTLGVVASSGSPPSNTNCAQWVVTGGVYILGYIGSPCGTGTTNNAAQYAIAYYSAAGTVNTVSGLAAPTTNADWFSGYHITGSAASAPIDEELVASTTNSVGLTVTPTYNATGPTQRFEITGSSYTGNATTATNASGLVGCTTSTAGSICYWNGSAWVVLAGNASGTNWLQATSSGVLSWTTPGGSGTVTVVGAGSLTSTALVTGGGTTTLQTPSATSTLSSGGNISLAGTITGASSVTLGANGGTGGSVVLNGATSGSATINTSGTGILALPSGTTATSMGLTTPLLGTPTSGVITNLTGTCTSCVASSANAVNSNTFPASAGFTSGGILYNSSTSAQATTALLTHYGLVYGGGAAGSPVSMAACGANFPVVGVAAAAPACSTIGWLASATQWGIPYMSTATQMSTTAALTANALIKAGSSAAPSASAVTDNGTLVTSTEPLTLTPGVRSSGALAYMTVNAPADTGITTATEDIGINHVGATRTWVDGTVATQREYLFQAPTYNKTTTSATFTKAATLAVSAAPTAGSGVTITNPYAFWVQAGTAELDGGAVTTTVSASTSVTSALYATTTKCAAAGSAASPSLVACSAAPAGLFSCATNASAATCVISTTAVTANSVIQIQPDSSLGTALSVTCNTTADSALTAPRVSARSAGTSFTITLGTFTTNPECFSYLVIN